MQREHHINKKHGRKEFIKSLRSSVHFHEFFHQKLKYCLCSVRMETISSSEKNASCLKLVKIVTWPMAVWPLSDDLFSKFRIIMLIITQVLKHLYFYNPYKFPK